MKFKWLQTVWNKNWSSQFSCNNCNIMHLISCALSTFFREWHPWIPFSDDTQNYQSLQSLLKNRGCLRKDSINVGHRKCELRSWKSHRNWSLNESGDSVYIIICLKLLFYYNCINFYWSNNSFINQFPFSTDCLAQPITFLKGLPFNRFIFSTNCLSKPIVFLSRLPFSTDCLAQPNAFLNRLSFLTKLINLAQPDDYLNRFPYSY